MILFTINDRVRVIGADAARFHEIFGGALVRSPEGVPIAVSANCGGVRACVARLEARGITAEVRTIPEPAQQKWWNAEGEIFYWSLQLPRVGAGSAVRREVQQKIRNAKRRQRRIEDRYHYLTEGVRR